MQTLTALAKFTGRLVAAQKKGAEKGDGGRGEIMDFGVQVVFELRHPGTGLAELKGPLGFPKTVKRPDDGGFIKMSDRFAIGGLIAGGDQGVERQRIGIRHEDFFFEKATQDAGLFEGERKHGEDGSTGMAREIGFRGPALSGGGDSWRQGRF